MLSEKKLLKTVLIDALLVLAITGTFAAVNRWQTYLSVEGQNDSWTSFVFSEFYTITAFVFVVYLSKQVEKLIIPRSKRNNSSQNRHLGD